MSARVQHRDLSEVAATFASEGHVVLSGLVERERAAALVEHLQDLDADAAQENPLSRGAMAFYSLLWPRSEPLRSLLCDPSLVGAVGAVLGPDLWVRWDQAVDKGPGAGTFPWHQDNEYSKLLGEHVQAWVCLTPSRPEVGGLELVPRRLHARLPHRIEDGHVVLEPELPTMPVSLLAEPGDVVLFSSYTLHRTTPNTTDRHRWAYVAEYLPLHEPDPFLDPPYLVVARGGRPTCEVRQDRPWPWGAQQQDRYADLLAKPWHQR
jgi:hypothetical protein